MLYVELWVTLSSRVRLSLHLDSLENFGILIPIKLDPYAHQSRSVCLTLILTFLVRYSFLRTQHVAYE